MRAALRWNFFFFFYEFQQSSLYIYVRLFVFRAVSYVRCIAADVCVGRRKRIEPIYDSVIYIEVYFCDFNSYPLRCL